MTATPASRPSAALFVVGVILVVAGVAIVATRALRFIYFGPGGLDVVQVPRDAVEPFGIVFVTSSVVAGSVLALIGAILIAGWVGYRTALRGRRKGPGPTP